jgi:hypothetical protein
VDRVSNDSPTRIIASRRGCTKLVEEEIDVGNHSAPSNDEIGSRDLGRCGSVTGNEPEP